MDAKILKIILSQRCQEKINNRDWFNNVNQLKNSLNGVSNMHLYWEKNRELICENDKYNSKNVVSLVNLNLELDLEGEKFLFGGKLGFRFKDKCLEFYAFFVTKVEGNGGSRGVSLNNHPQNTTLKEASDFLKEIWDKKEQFCLER